MKMYRLGSSDGMNTQCHCITWSRS